MKNPLNKRLPREFKTEFTKYLVIFMFMTLVIGFISGFLVSGGSMKAAYDESFDKYNIEDGHFVVDEKAGSEVIKKIEENGVRIFENFYIDEETDVDNDGEYDCTVRVFMPRDEVDKVCLMEGEYPSNSEEIALDRMFADNNSLNIGDTITVKNIKLKITGLVALSDYSALFSNNTDLMFDSIKFGVAVINKDCFDSFGNEKIKYSYSFVFNTEPKDETEAKEMSDEFLNELVKITKLTDYIPEYSSSAIHFTGDDMGGDRTMMIVLLYILIVILAFVFSVTINHTITKESAVIGTLRASGYKKGELVRHYLVIPMIVTLLAAIIGNVLGYSLFKNIVVNMYYGSYSLPTYKTIWNGEAFVLTTVIPMILMILINIISLVKRLQLSPLKFIRRDLSKSKRKKAIKLPHFKFFNRFRIRVIIQNASNYVVLFIGILFANVMLLFGMMMPPLLDNFQDKIIDNMISEYQYILKYGVEVENDSAQKYIADSLKIVQEDNEGEQITVYGISDNSKYITNALPEKAVLVSDTYAEKYSIEKGDTITLCEVYGTKEYEFKVAGIIVYPSSLSIFMTDKYYCDIFDKEEGYFNGYFSNEELMELEDAYVAAVITKDDLIKVSRQLDKSMGNMFQLVNVFAIALTALLIYLLTKLIIEKNTNSISMVKILGYKNSEIAKLYLMANTWVVVIAEIISLFGAFAIIDMIYFAMMKGYSGWLSFYIAPVIYVENFIIVIVVYLIVALLQFRKIKKIPMDEALKNVE